jgi:hypothetical protein
MLVEIRRPMVRQVLLAVGLLTVFAPDALDSQHHALLCPCDFSL